MDFIYSIRSRHWKWAFFAVLIGPFAWGLAAGAFLTGMPAALHFAAIIGTLLAWLKTQDRENRQKEKPDND